MKIFAAAISPDKEWGQHKWHSQNQTNKQDIKNTKFEVRNTKQIRITKHKIQNIQQYEARNARYEKGICLEFQIILSLEFVSDFVFRISDFTITGFHH
ncbi:MAG: hypothetical protein CV080_11390 [Candidatus Kuenenia stuttgartiensis]|nr:MAG: hypothetical protein CV080_11390 [Candidatus Kuenenia stuttgartiensis]